MIGNAQRLPPPLKPFKLIAFPFPGCGVDDPDFYYTERTSQVGPLRLCSVKIRRFIKCTSDSARESELRPRSTRSCRWTFTAPPWRCGAGRRHAVAPYVPRSFRSSLTAGFDYTSHTVNYATSVFRCNFSNNVTSQTGTVVLMNLFFPLRRPRMTTTCTHKNANSGCSKRHTSDIVHNGWRARSVGPGDKEFLMFQCIKCNVSFHFHLERGWSHFQNDPPRVSVSLKQQFIEAGSLIFPTPHRHEKL